MMGLAATVLGGSGFSGGEVLRLLARHPSIDVVAVGAGARAGAPVASVHPHLSGIALELEPLEAVAASPADVVFSCLPGGILPPLVAELEARVVVDLSGDHRAASGWVYGLTEMARDGVAGATRIANPGCYPTATLLGLVPFVAPGVVEGPIVVDALSGYSGAGSDARTDLLLAHAAGSARAYGTVAHRHVPEIERGLLALAGGSYDVSFTPHLVPMARGLLVTARARIATTLDDAAAISILRDAYEDETFVVVVDSWPETKAVAGTNLALVTARVDARTGWLVVSVAIDNLGKGAAGQAVQNANLALGLDEGAGLDGVAVWP